MGCLVKGLLTALYDNAVRQRCHGMIFAWQELCHLQAWHDFCLEPGSHCDTCYSQKTKSMLWWYHFKQTAKTAGSRLLPRDRADPAGSRESRALGSDGILPSPLSDTQATANFAVCFSLEVQPCFMNLKL
jgi:hypothetical protein